MPISTALAGLSFQTQLVCSYHCVLPVTQIEPVPPRSAQGWFQLFYEIPERHQCVQAVYVAAVQNDCLSRGAGVSGIRICQNTMLGTGTWKKISATSTVKGRLAMSSNSGKGTTMNIIYLHCLSQKLVTLNKLKAYHFKIRMWHR